MAQTSAYNSIADVNSQVLLGRYRVIEQRDKGGFGSVLACWDIRLQRRVAVKCLPLNENISADEGMYKATIDDALFEARASSALAHPNIVTVHDVDFDDDFAYIIMEYVEGVTLAELLSRVEGGCLVWSEVAYVVDCLASALDFAHEHGVLHLDIKPANVLIANDGCVKLTDFGMAALTSYALYAGARGGTVGYMPPEQLKGEMVDERCDIFALACVAYQALTGVNPFAAKNDTASLKLIEKGAPPINKTEPDLDLSVMLAFNQAFSPNPDGRQIIAEDFANEIVPALGDPSEGKESIKCLLEQQEGDEVEFHPSEWRALDPPARRIPWITPLVTKVACALVLGLLAWNLSPIILSSPIFVNIVQSESFPQFVPRVILSAIAVASGALWTPIGAVMGFALLVLSIVSFELTPPVVLLLIILIAAGFIWVQQVSRLSKLSAAALFLGSAIGPAAVTPGFSGYVMHPIAAGFTSSLAALLSQFIAMMGFSQPVPHLISDQIIDTQILGDIVLKFFSDPAVWLWALVCGGIAALISAISHPRTDEAPSRARLIVAQLLGGGVQFLAIECSIALKANGVLPQISVNTIIYASFAVICCICMVVVVWLFGPAEER